MATLFYSTTLDYESTQEYDFTITATDRGLGSRHNTPGSHVIIRVTDVNDNDPVFDPAEYSEFDFTYLVSCTLDDNTYIYI